MDAVGQVGDVHERRLLGQRADHGRSPQPDRRAEQGKEVRVPRPVDGGRANDRHRNAVGVSEDGLFAGQLAGSVSVDGAGLGRLVQRFRRRGGSRGRQAADVNEPAQLDAFSQHRLQEAARAVGVHGEVLGPFPCPCQARAVEHVVDALHGSPQRLRIIQARDATFNVQMLDPCRVARLAHEADDPDALGAQPIGEVASHESRRARHQCFHAPVSSSDSRRRLSYRPGCPRVEQRKCACRLARRLTETGRPRRLRRNLCDTDRNSRSA